jgi:hypothetical protein
MIENLTKKYQISIDELLKEIDEILKAASASLSHECEDKTMSH